jgi:hypothetical protein
MEASIQFFDGVMSWFDSDELHLAYYDQVSFKLSSDVHRLALDAEDRLLGFKAVPSEMKLEHHVVFVSQSEVALVRLNIPRSKIEKPDL